MLTTEIQSWQRIKQNCSHLTETNAVLYWSSIILSRNTPVTEASTHYRPAFSQLVRHKEMLQRLEGTGRDPADPGAKSSVKI